LRTIPLLNSPLMKRPYIIFGSIVVLLGVIVVVIMDKRRSNIQLPATVTSYEECIAAGYPVMESWPPRCAVPNGSSFTQDIGNELDKTDLIRIDSPRPTQQVSSPLVVTGQARGNWFFEASFPVKLLDSSGVALASGIATAQAGWMTEDFVPFTATLTYNSPVSGGAGTLVLQRDNPSGLPENDDQLIVPVVLGASTNTGLIRSCPDEKIINHMPPGPETSYYIERGKRAEIADYDESWVLANCAVPVQVVQ
jgi:hypothetical protein